MLGLYNIGFRAQGLGSILSLGSVGFPAQSAALSSAQRLQVSCIRCAA